MNAIDILARWAEYSDYDPEQKSFNLLSTNYEMNRISKSVAAINEFDPTGTMGVLYVKQAFENLCKDVRVPHVGTSGASRRVPRGYGDVVSSALE